MDLSKIREKRQQLRDITKPRAIPKGTPVTPEAIGQTILAELAPALQSIRQAIANINIQFPEIKIPAPIVNIPAPIVNIPKQDVNFPEQRALTDGIDRNRPLPVMMMGQDGKPYQFMFPGASGGRGDFFTISDIRSSTSSLIDQTENALRVTGAFASSLNVDYGSGPVGSATLRVVQATDVGTSVNIIGANVTIGVVTINPDGLPVYGGSGSGGGLTDAELRASSVPVAQASGAMWSTAMFGSQDGGLSWEPILANGDGVFIQGSVGVMGHDGSDSLTFLRTDQDGRLIVSQLSGANWSVYATGAGASFFAEIMNPDGRVKVTGAGTSQYQEGVAYDESVTYSVIGYLSEEDGGPTQVGLDTPLPVFDEFLSKGMRTSGQDSMLVSQVAGVNWSINTQQLGGTNIAVGSGVDGAGVQRIVHVTDVGQSSNMMTTLDSTNDSIGVLQVSGSNFSVFVTGSMDSMGAWEARTTNPTAKADGADVRPKTDDLGRQLMRPFQVRDLVQSAYVANLTGATFGTEKTLRAAVAGAFLDLIYLRASNDSTVAITVDIRDALGGSVVMTMTIPATGQAEFTPSMPLQQNNQGNAWTIDAPDVTGTNIYFTGIFSQEI